MGVNGLGGFRPDTYTFADVFGIYKKEIQLRLEASPPVGLGPGVEFTGADSLETMSMRAFDAALPLASSVMP